MSTSAGRQWLASAFLWLKVETKLNEESSEQRVIIREYSLDNTVIKDKLKAHVQII